MRELIDGALARLTVSHGIERQRSRVAGSRVWARHIGWRLRMGRANEQSESSQGQTKPFHCQPSPWKQCEGATGSLAILASDHGPSHPYGLTHRIAIANDVPRGATSRHVDASRNAGLTDWFREASAVSIHSGPSIEHMCSRSGS